MQSLSAPTRPNKVSKPRTHRRPERLVEVLIRPGLGVPDPFIRVTQDGKEYCYWLVQIPSDYGTAYRFEQSGQQLDGLSEYQSESYDVLHGRSCECPGHLRWGTQCRHLWALAELIRQGEIEERRPELYEGASYKPGHDSDLPF